MLKTKIWPEPKVVVIGGGSGVSSILPGIKKYTNKITAVIAVSDDGGSTGRLRDDLGIIAPGDIRNCLVSLANTDRDMRDLFEYRFNKGELKGHSFGNLFIAAMSEIYKDFGRAIYKTGEILSITGKVLPITLENTFLVAELENGTSVVGESKIEDAVIKEKTRISRIYLQPEEVNIFDDAKEDIKQADYIILGPGSLYTSIIPNLLAKDMANLIIESKAKVIYVANAVTQHGETDNYGVRDHYDALIKHSGKEFIDSIIVNKMVPDNTIIEKYKKTNSRLILLSETDRKYLENKGIKIIEGDILRVIDETIRHDSDKLANLIFMDHKNRKKRI